MELALWALSVFVLYWIVRMAVRHGIEDADWKRFKRRQDGKGW